MRSPAFTALYCNGGSVSKGSACSTGDQGSIPGLGRYPWRRKWQPTPVLLPAKSHGQRSLVGYSPWVTTVRYDLVTKPPPETENAREKVTWPSNIDYEEKKTTQRGNTIHAYSRESCQSSGQEVRGGRTELEKGARKCQELFWPRVLGSISWGAEREMS